MRSDERIAIPDSDFDDDRSHIVEDDAVTYEYSGGARVPLPWNDTGAFFLNLHQNCPSLV